MNGVHIPHFPKPFAISPDGRAVAAGPADGAVSLWDVALGKAMDRSPTPSLKGFQAVAFAENGRTLVTAGYGSPPCVWDVASGRRLREFGREPGWVTALAVSPDGGRVALGGYAGGIRIWDVTKGAEVCASPGHHGPLWKVLASPDGRTVVSTGEDNTLRLWDLADGRERRRVEVDDFGLSEPVLTPDGKAVLACGKTGLRLWDVPTLRPLRAPGALAKDTGLPQAFSADGRILLTRSDSGVALWDWPSGTLRRDIVAPKEGGGAGKPIDYYNASLSADGRLVATVRWGGDGVSGSSLEFWDAATGRRLQESLHQSRGLSWVRFVPGQSVALVGDNSFLPIFRLGKRAKAQPLPGFALWEVTRPQRRPDLVAPMPELQRHWRPMLYAALSPDGRTLATSLDGRAVTLFEVATGHVRRQLPAGHRGDITSLEFTPDGRRLLSASRDQTALVWDVSLATAAGPAGADVWAGLADGDAGAAYQAMARLAADPAKAVTLLRDRLKPVSVPDDAALDRLVAELDSPMFAVRTRAAAEMDRLGPAIALGVVVRLAKVESLELRRRLEQYLDKHDRGVPPPEALRQLRAVELLEHLGTPAARALLRDLAGGSPVVRLTQDAAAALRRLGR
jgi:WD40 repeat protein